MYICCLLPNFLSLPTACINLSLLMFGDKVNTALTFYFIIMSAPLVLASSNITKV